MDSPNEFKSEFNARHSLLLRRIMGILSKDSRTRINDIAIATGVSRRTVALRLNAMENELKLSYTLEFNEERLGLTRPHLILAKFGSRPDYARIAALLKRSHIPQLALSIEGTYDMLIYANALSGIEYAHWDKSMQTLLSEYKVEWHASEVVHRQLGFFPLRNEIIEKAPIKEKYKKMLGILNRNSRIRFQELARELGMNVNTATYNFNKLLKLDYIKSFTLTMGVPNDVLLMTFFSKYTPSEGYEKASAAARREFTSDDYAPLISRYLITAPLIGSYDFFTLGAFDNSDIAYKMDILYHKNLFRKYNVRILHGKVKGVLLGRLPIRSIDTKKEYKTIIWSTE